MTRVIQPVTGPCGRVMSDWGHDCNEPGVAYAPWWPERVLYLCLEHTAEKKVLDQPRHWRCDDCHGYQDDYMVTDEIWALSGIGPNDGDGLLCLSCLEERIGRYLVPDDFPDWIPANQTVLFLLRRLHIPLIGEPPYD